MQLIERSQEVEDHVVLVERRAQPLPEAIRASPVWLAAHYGEQARSQLREARLQLIAARRRVGELQEAVRNWDQLTEDLS